MPIESIGGCGIPQSGITGIYELPNVLLETEPVSSAGAAHSLTTEQSLQPFTEDRLACQQTSGSPFSKPSGMRSRQGISSELFVLITCQLPV